MPRVLTAVAVAVALIPAATGAAVSTEAAAAAARTCEPVTFAGIADFRLTHIRATGVRCGVARQVVRGARLHTRWRSHGFSCKVTGYEPEVSTFHRCTKGAHRRITFQS